MRYLFTLILAGLACICQAQKESSPFNKFGKISLKNLETKTYDIDKNANAVVLSDIGQSSIKGNTKGWFSMITKRHAVIHILNKNGYDEANIRIPLYVDGKNEETVTGLKAITYNLEDGKIKQTKLEKSGQFMEVIDKNRKVLKFTLPQVREGSIIEFQYQVNSDFISVLDPWYFQRLTAPTLWSEFIFSVPAFFKYNALNRGYLPIAISEQHHWKDQFNVTFSENMSGTQRASFAAEVTDYRWVIKNAPELKTENFTFSVRNHIARLEFQLAAQSDPLVYKSYRSTWEEITSNLLLSESFGEKLNANNNWMSEDIKPLLSGAENNYQKAVRIFEFVRDNFKSTGNYGVQMNQTLRNVFRARQGSVPEINLLLTAILRYAGLNANPVLVSTTSHGYSVEFSPMLHSMNYLVVQLIENGNQYYLDATVPRLSFNRLPLYCYNGHSRVVNASATPLYFSADSIKETKYSRFFMGTNEQGKFIGHAEHVSGYYESFSRREEIAAKGKEEFYKNIQTTYGDALTISTPSIDSLEEYEMPLKVKYQMDFNNDGEDIIYINPTFSEGYKKNPFATTERVYPVEMPYTFDETIYTTIEVPAGYKIDEYPKQLVVKLDEKGESFFEYRLTISDNFISFLNRTKINRTFYMPEEYDHLREFFNLVVKKQSEQIVLKKIN